MANYPLLKQGDHLPTVGVLQKLLNRTGTRLAVDGIFGPKTRAAVLEFQRARQLPPDGIVGTLTWSRLAANDSLPIVDCIDIFDPALMTNAHDVIAAGGHPILIGGMSGGMTVVTQKILAMTQKLFLLRFIGHGRPGIQAISFGVGGERGADGKNHGFGDQRAAFYYGNVQTVRFLGLQRAFGPYASVQLQGCRVALGVKGRNFVTELAAALEVPVTASPHRQRSDFGFDGATFTALPRGGSLRDWCAALPDFPAMSVR